MPGYDPSLAGAAPTAQGPGLPGGPLANFGANLTSRWLYGGPIMAGDMPLNTVLSMIHGHQQKLAIEQASTDRRLLQQSVNNFMLAVRGPNATPQQQANIQRLAGDIAGPVSQLWGQAMMNPQAYQFLSQNAGFLGHVGPLAGSILARGAFGAMRAQPGGMFGAQGQQAAALAQRIHQAAVLPNGRMNMSFTAGLGAFEMSNLLTMGSRFGVNPQQLSNLRALNYGGARLGSMMGAPASQAMAQFNATTGALYQMGPGGVARLAGGMQAGALAAGMPGAQGVAAAIQGAQMAQQRGMLPVTGALLSPGALAATPYALAAQGTGFFGAMGPGQMESTLMQRSLAGVASPVGTAIGGVFQAIQSAAQSRGVGTQGGPLGMLRRMGAGSGLSSLVGGIMGGNADVGLLSNPAALSQQLSGLGISQGLAERLVTTPTAATQGLAAQYGQQALLTAQNQAVASSVIQPAVRQALGAAGMNTGSDRIAQLLTERMMQGGAQNSGQVSSMLESIMRRLGRSVPSGGVMGSAGAEVYNTVDLALQGRGLPGLSQFAGMSAGIKQAPAMTQVAQELSRLNELLSQHFNLKAGVAGRALVDLGTKGGAEGVKSIMGIMGKSDFNAVMSTVRDLQKSGGGGGTHSRKTESTTREYDSGCRKATNETFVVESAA